ncbi:PREDICTED: putative leucine-rich repeat-containing protein DDB_G0290503 [Papilio polytes]|uniref:putative leucine-rich repeat-containing protein DDB_G0290503 n=1 Tax=Papilio polytes TaxID=76194 RepID=UPI0006767284|nr:PREDICTED: putative leucine-rich repeat-containing protein DDB_G0290503 [Papilio polytes]
MDDTEKLTSQTTDHKNVLPDVVHSQQIPTMSTVEGDETESVLDTGQTTEGAKSKHIKDDAETESISEHVPSEIEYSVTVSDNIHKGHTSHDLNIEKDKTADNSSNILPPQSDTSNIEDPSKLSWNVDIENNAHLSKESPVNLTTSIDTKSLPIHTENKQEDLENEGKSDLSEQQQDDKMDEVDSPKESLCSEYLDSLNEDVSQDSYSTNDNNMSDTSKNFENKAEESPRENSESEEIIKLDIRGHGVPKFPMQAAKIIFGPPPEGSMIIESQIDPIPAFQNLLSPFLVGSEGVKVEEIYDEVEEKSQQPAENSPVESLLSDKTEKDLLIEEMTVENAKEKDEECPTQLKSMPVEETISLSTMTTDYKTICEEYQEKLVYLEDAMTRRDELIAELTVSLQRSVQERDQLKHDKNHLVSELQHLQHATAETPLSEHDTVKAQLSDFVKYQSMVKDDSTKFYSAVMSGTTSLQSSNGEKDIDREEITVNYSKSDLRSSDTDDFENGFEVKVVTLLNKFEEYIEENLRNKLRESIIQVLCDEIGKMRIEFDTEMKEVEAQLQQDKQAYSIETRRLRELLACVKAGNADIDALREELSIKHEKEMENLRTYFEKKCSDMERSYSEEVWRGRACASPPSGAASECLDAAAGDCRRRTRSAEFPSLTYESTPLEQLMKQLHRKYEQQSEELRAEQAQRVAALEEQIRQLKAHIQSAETDGNVSIYPQDIDLELEKDAVESRLEEVRQEVLDQIQEQIKVLLSDPDAELSSWPLELVALRDRIHGDARALQDKEVPSLREEAPSAAETDKWRQRRYNSFDQNRQLEEVTKERDALQRVAASLQRCVGQLVAYCASAEDELNRTVLARLLATLLPDEQSFVEECGRGSVGGVETFFVILLHIVMWPWYKCALYTMWQLEAAHRQLRATRQFVEEQAAEREHERDEFARRLHDARDDNQRLLARLQTNARILAEMHELRAHCCHRKVEQLEAQTRDMNQIITDLEAKKTNSDEELKSYEEKVVLLRDIIANLESQLEQKNKREADILQQLESMQQTIEDRDSKMRALLGELESLKNEKVDQSEVVCENCNQEEHRYKELLDNITEQCRWLEAEVQERARLLQQAHEQTSACCSEPSEDVSLRDKAPLPQERGAAPQTEWVCALALVREAVRGLARAEDAALKRVADLRMQRDQLRDVAQVRAAPLRTGVR